MYVPFRIVKRNERAPVLLSKSGNDQNNFEPFTATSWHRWLQVLSTDTTKMNVLKSSTTLLVLFFSYSDLSGLVRYIVLLNAVSVINIVVKIERKILYECYNKCSRISTREILVGSFENYATGSTTMSILSLRNAQT